MKKRIAIAKFAFATALSFSLLSLTACINENHVIQPGDKNIVSITVKEGTVPNEIFIGHFDEAGITLIVQYSDNTSEEVRVTTEMIPEQYRSLLDSEGEYDIKFLYRGEIVSIHIKMVIAHYLVNFYAYVDSPTYTLVDSQDIKINQDASEPTVSQDVYFEGMHYSFTSWDKVFTNITASKDVYAQYDSIEYYVVNFYNGNNELIDTQNVDKGDDAVEPSAALRNMEDYDFLGWDRDYTNVNSNLDVYGLYANISPFKVTIELSTTLNNTLSQILIDAADRLMEKDNTINVVYTKHAGSYDELKEYVLSKAVDGSYPDIISSYNQSVIDFLNAGIALDISNEMNNRSYGLSQDDRNDIFQAYLEQGSNYPVSGTYSMPLIESTDAMYYNQDVLIGLDLHNIDATINNGNPLDDDYFQDMTWEELFEKLIPALEIKDTQEKAAGRAGLIDKRLFNDWAWAGYDSDQNFFINLAKQYGYDCLDVNETTGEGEILFNNDGMKALLTKFKGYYDKHYFTTKGIINTNVNYRSTADAMLFSIGLTGGAKYQYSDITRHNVGVAPIPHAEGGQSKSLVSSGPSLAFLDHNDPDRAKAAWLLYKEIISPESCLDWSLTSGYAPIRKSVAEMQDYIDYCDVSTKEDHSIYRLFALNGTFQASVGDIVYSIPPFYGSGKVQSAIDGIFARCVAYGYNVDEAFNYVYTNSLDYIRKTPETEGIVIKNKKNIGEAVVGYRCFIDIAINPATNIIASLNNGDLTITSSDEDIAITRGLYVYIVGTGSANLTVRYQDMVETIDLNKVEEPPESHYDTVHKGTIDDPFTNEDALIVAKTPEYAGEVFYVKGIVDSFYHFPGSRDDGAVSYYLTPATEGGEKFMIYKCYKENGGHLTDEDIWIGGEAIAYGRFTRYGDQYETSTATFVQCI